MEKSMGFPDAELYVESFEKSFKKSNILENRHTLKILGVAISSHLFFFRFLQIWKTKTGRFEAEESAVTGEKFLIISNEKILEPIEKTSYWSASVYNTILVITVIYIFLLLYFTSVLL